MSGSKKEDAQLFVQRCDELCGHYSFLKDTVNCRIQQSEMYVSVLALSNQVDVLTLYFF